MRCLFLDALTERERAELDAFDDGCRSLFNALENAPPTDEAELRRQVAELDPGFDLTAVTTDSGKLCVELKASEPAAKPRLERFASMAPGSMVVRTGAGPQPLEELLKAVEPSSGRSLADARVRAGFARGHLLDLVVHLRQASGSEDESALLAAENAVYGLLGDQLADDWIGRIDVAPLPRGGPLKLVGADSELERTFPLDALKATVENAIRGLYQGMSQSGAEHSVDPGQWTLLETEPVDGSSSTQSDLVYASTRLPEMLKSFLEGAPFSSCRFSSIGERFAYLKYRHDGDAETRALERQALEDEVDGKLAASGAGHVVGNGLGLRHSYIDLALSDVPHAVASLRELGQRRNLPRSSWILFCDTEWSREWIGVWSDSPGPSNG